MKINILADNYPGTHTGAEHGLSYLIEHDGKKILFDTGQSNLFLKNAEIMKVDMTNIDVIILSHGHFDHGNGLQFLSGGTLICHPGCFVKRFRKFDHTYIGLKNTKQEIARKFNLIKSVAHCEITKRIMFLGQIPRIMDYESQSTSFIYEDGTPDFVIDDTAIALLLKEGIFVVTGCGHSGIVNTLEHARTVTGEKRIFGITGGFHLKQIDRQTKKTISYLKEQHVQHVYPSHCTARPALEAFYENFEGSQLKTGDVVEI